MSIDFPNESNRIKWIEDKLSLIPAGTRILDAGAGEQKYKKFCKHLEYVSQDFGRYNGIGDSKGLQTKNWDTRGIDIISDIINVPEPDQSFGAIMCIEVFEHLPNPITALYEFARLLREDGFLIITAPFCSLTHFSPYHFYSGFNKYFYQEQLRKYGFDILDISSNGNFFEYLGQEISRIPNIVEEYTPYEATFLEKLILRKVLMMLKNIAKRIVGQMIYCVLVIMYLQEKYEKIKE